MAILEWLVGTTINGETCVVHDNSAACEPVHMNVLHCYGLGVQTTQDRPTEGMSSLRYGTGPAMYLDQAYACTYFSCVYRCIGL